MKNLLIAFVILFPVVALSVPTENKLIKPESVMVKGPILEVTYLLPCETDDTATFVMNSDDSGDRTVAVGVVSSRSSRNCRAVPPKKFMREADPAVFGYSTRDSKFIPMDVK